MQVQCQLYRIRVTVIDFEEATCFETGLRYSSYFLNRGRKFKSIEYVVRSYHNEEAHAPCRVP